MRPPSCVCCCSFTSVNNGWVPLLRSAAALRLFHCAPPLSFLRALFLSYLAFSSLSPNNLFNLLSPTITPFLVIVSILFFFSFFFFSIFFHLTAAQGPPLGAGGSSCSRSDTSELERRLLRAGAVSVQKRLLRPSEEHSQPVCRSTHRLSKRRVRVFDANKKQPRGVKLLGALRAIKKKKGEKEKDAAVKNTNIGSSRKPPHCIHYCNLL